MTERRCVVCGSGFTVELRGRPRVYCSKRCRQRAYIGRQVLDAPSEIAGRPVRVCRSVDEAHGLIASSAEMLDEAASVFRRASEIAHVESEQMDEAERTGRTVWRYTADDEHEIREAAQAYRRFTDLWADWD